MSSPLKEDPWKNLREERARRQARKTGLGTVLMLTVVAGIGSAGLGYVAGLLAASRSHSRGFGRAGSQARAEASFPFKMHLGGAIGAMLGIGAAIRPVKDCEA